MEQGFGGTWVWMHTWAGLSVRLVSIWAVVGLGRGTRGHVSHGRGWQGGLSRNSIPLRQAALRRGGGRAPLHTCLYLSLCS